MPMITVHRAAGADGRGSEALLTGVAHPALPSLAWHVDNQKLTVIAIGWGVTHGSSKLDYVRTGRIR